jgi:hypothetical protein
MAVREWVAKRVESSSKADAGGSEDGPEVTGEVRTLTARRRIDEVQRPLNELTTLEWVRTCTPIRPLIVTVVRHQRRNLLTVFHLTHAHTEGSVCEAVAVRVEERTRVPAVRPTERHLIPVPQDSSEKNKLTVRLGATAEVRGKKGRLWCVEEGEGAEEVEILLRASFVVGSLCVARTINITAG